MPGSPMDRHLPDWRSHVTLALCTVLHAFTHAYGTMLVPLYLLIVADLRLGGVRAAAMIVAVYGLVNFSFSYAAGVLADRFDRKVLLGVGLLVNAAAVVAIGMTRRYEWIVALAVVAGLAASVFHPAANALVPAHYPRSPGMAIGLLGIGSGLGFFVGPQYAGWRAEAATWSWSHVAQWQKPCVELGAVGLVCGALFLLLARETPRPATADRAAPPPDEASPLVVHRRPLGLSLRWRTTAVAFALALRDFAGVATVTLVSVFLQRAHGRSVKEAGLVVGTMMLSGVIANPLAVYWSPGVRRLKALVAVLVFGGAVLATVPWLAARYTLPVLFVFYGMQLGSYAISDAAMLERVDNAVRGRVVGLFLSIAGTIGAAGPWAMGAWTDHVATAGRATDPLAYAPAFATVGALMALASVAAPLLARLGKPGSGTPPTPLSETMPATVGPVGG